MRHHRFMCGRREREQEEGEREREKKDMSVASTAPLRTPGAGVLQLLLRSRHLPNDGRIPFEKEYRVGRLSTESGMQCLQLLRATVRKAYGRTSTGATPLTMRTRAGGSQTTQITNLARCPPRSTHLLHESDGYLVLPCFRHGAQHLQRQ